MTQKLPDLIPKVYHPQGKIAIAAIMRNEGCFALEWVAYHLGIGFEQIFVATNKCQDGTNVMLARLAQIMPDRIFHYDNAPPAHLPLQQTQYKLIQSQPEIEDVDYLAIIDADEFIVVDRGEGSISDLLDHCGGADAIALLWKHFGDNGMERWTHGRLLPRQTMREKQPLVPRHKSIFRPKIFDIFDMHRPRAPRVSDPVIVNAKGTRLPNTPFIKDDEQIYAANSPDDWSWDLACIHHHSFRTQDLRLLKNHRGDAGDPKSKRNLRDSRWSRQTNRNDVEDRGSLTHDHRTREYLDFFLRDPVLNHLQKDAENWLDKIRADILTPEQIWRWTHPKSSLWNSPEAPSRAETFKK